MNTTKQNFLNECISRYNEVKDIWGHVPTQIFVDAFNTYYSVYTKRQEGDECIFVDNLLINDCVYLKGYRRRDYKQDETIENIWHVNLETGAQYIHLKDIDTNKPTRANIIEINN